MQAKTSGSWSPPPMPNSRHSCRRRSRRAWGSAIPCAIAQSTAIDQIVMHLAAPFMVGGGDEGFAETGRAAIVHREHRIASVGEPLVDRAETPGVAIIRPAWITNTSGTRPASASTGRVR